MKAIGRNVLLALVVVSAGVPDGAAPAAATAAERCQKDIVSSLRGCNEARPHSSIRDREPTQYAASLIAWAAQ